MNLDVDDYRHIHKVLSSDIQECEIFLEERSTANMSDGQVARFSKRISEDKRVLARVEEILGDDVPEWVPVMGE